MMARELKQMGYRLPSPRSLKTKHVNALVNGWMERGLAPGTIKNYASELRWWAEKVEKFNLIPRSNKELGVAQRVFDPRNKAQTLSSNDFARVEDEYLRHSLMLQQAFGLRCEECLKFRPSYADKGHFIKLKGSWTKGGRPRSIPITDVSQREILDRVAKLVGKGSLIPAHKLYVQQLAFYRNKTLALGFRNLHGLRHGYAQRRYQMLTGWKCPKAGGPIKSQLTAAQFVVDQEVRLTISRELGHNRIEITKQYMGR